MTYDALVIGLGAMGSAALYHLAARGQRVIGVDALTPPHALGSTHGRTRIIREAYYERAIYVPLVRRAYANWAALERETETHLFQRTGGLMIGARDSALIAGTVASAETHGIAVEQLTAADIRRRFPAFAPADDMVGVLEQNAGLLFPESCVRSHLFAATARGAEVRMDTRVFDIARSSGAITVATNGGSISARRIVLAAGPWTSELLGMLGASLPLAVERQTMHWLDSTGDRAPLAPGRFPVMMIEFERDRLFYATPDVGDGVKAALHHEGGIVTPETVQRAVTTDDTRPVLDLVTRYIPGASGSIHESAVCLYTDTPDRDFVVGPLNADPDVLLLSACSGHGFKFASAIGEIAALLAIGERPAVDLSPFDAGRFTGGDAR